jgi:hypothetical protein
MRKGVTLHVQPMSEDQGEFRENWKPTLADNPYFRCQQCGSHDVWYRVWDSACGGFEDVKYNCRGCGRTWWCEGSDA